MESDIPRPALIWLRRVCAATEATAGVTWALYGVNCPSPVAFSDDLVLLPSRDVPQSRMRDHVLNRLGSSIEAHPRRPTAVPVSQRTRHAEAPPCGVALATASIA